MRGALNGLYRLSAALSASFLCLIFVVVLAQVCLNITDKVVQLATSRPIGLLIPSYADFAGYFLAAATFFALAASFQRGAHIRVSLLLTRFPARVRMWVETWAAAVAVAMSSYFAWYAARLARDSYRFGDLSPGLIAIPIWIPQLAMTLGLAALAIAAADALVTVLSGRLPAYAQGEGELKQIMEE